ncbi:MAG: helix-turn-helix transcriptional regulator [Rhizobiales bacterium]|nr:helix-turn-helix transcriptional regulator [Hyphomicrobiales bacterium]
MSTASLRVIEQGRAAPPGKEILLDAVFAALADPVRRSILNQLDGKTPLVSEIARSFDISLQAVSKHIQVLVRAGLVHQERTGRISRCSLVAGPIYEASVWLNRYSKYWQEQFDLLAASLHDIESHKPRRALRSGKVRKPRRHAK